MVDGSLDVLQHAGGGQGLDRSLVAKALAHVILGVAQLHSRLDAMKAGRRDRQIAFGRVAIGHMADVAVDAKDFLDHHHGAARGAGGAGFVGGHRGAVGGLEFDQGSHGFFL